MIIDQNYEILKNEFKKISDNIIMIENSLLLYCKNIKELYNSPNSISNNLKLFYQNDHPLSMYSNDIIEKIKIGITEWENNQNLNFKSISNFSLKIKNCNNLILSIDDDKIITNNLINDQNKKNEYINLKSKLFKDVKDCFNCKINEFDIALINIQLSIHSLFELINQILSNSSPLLQNKINNINPILNLLPNNDFIKQQQQQQQQQQNQPAPLRPAPPPLQSQQQQQYQQTISKAPAPQPFKLPPQQQNQPAPLRPAPPPLQSQQQQQQPLRSAPPPLQQQPKGPQQQQQPQPLRSAPPPLQQQQPKGLAPQKQQPPLLLQQQQYQPTISKTPAPQQSQQQQKTTTSFNNFFKKLEQSITTSTNNFSNISSLPKAPPLPQLINDHKLHKLLWDKRFKIVRTYTYSVKAEYKIEIKYKPGVTLDRLLVWMTIPESNQNQVIRNSSMISFDGNSNRELIKPEIVRSSHQDIWYFKYQSPPLPFKTHFVFKEYLEADLYRNEIVEVLDPNEVIDFEPITAEEIEIYLRPTNIMNFDDPEFPEFLQTYGFIPKVFDDGTMETILCFAYRIYLWMTENITYKYPHEFSGKPMETVKVKQGDCGSHSYLMCSIMRYHSIPTRLLFGRHAELNKPGDPQVHVKPEIYIENLGWVPIEATNKTKNGYCNSLFGIDKGSFLTFGMDIHSDVKDLSNDKNPYSAFQQINFSNYYKTGPYPDRELTKHDYNVSSL